MTMPLHEYVQFWILSAKGDWEASQTLIKDNHPKHAMFCIYLSLEKLLKANWILDNGETFPPMTHNLENLFAQTELDLEIKDVDLLKLINTWNIEGRYQDYRNKLSKSYTKEYIKEKLIHIEDIRKCLLERLP